MADANFWEGMGGGSRDLDRVLNAIDQIRDDIHAIRLEQSRLASSMTAVTDRIERDLVATTSKVAEGEREFRRLEGRIEAVDREQALQNATLAALQEKVAEIRLERREEMIQLRNRAMVTAGGGGVGLVALIEGARAFLGP